MSFRSALVVSVATCLVVTLNGCTEETSTAAETATGAGSTLEDAIVVADGADAITPDNQLEMLAQTLDVLFSNARSDTADAIVAVSTPAKVRTAIAATDDAKSLKNTSFDCAAGGSVEVFARNDAAGSRQSFEFENCVVDGRSLSGISDAEVVAGGALSRVNYSLEASNAVNSLGTGDFALEGSVNTSCFQCEHQSFEIVRLLESSGSVSRQVRGSGSLHTSLDAEDALTEATLAIDMTLESAVDDASVSFSALAEQLGLDPATLVPRRGSLTLAGTDGSRVVMSADDVSDAHVVLHHTSAAGETTTRRVAWGALRQD
ncbi:MAG: hypothetical protein CSB44_04375 [Gammaproteobacteria bacterium]|nr:MAG: hypothetical protein CSB44_04375 [Gammaproteobacteria bacterium]